MYNRGKQRLDALETKLAALREEARGGYGKEEVRRNRIKADLQAERLAKEKRMRERLDFLTTEPSVSARGGVEGSRDVSGSAGAAVMASLDDEAASRSHVPAPYEEGDLSLEAFHGSSADAQLGSSERGSLSSAEATAAVVDTVMTALTTQMANYQALMAAAEDYDYDAQLEDKMRRVQSRDDLTGLPTRVLAPQRPAHTDMASLDGLANLDSVDRRPSSVSAASSSPAPRRSREARDSVNSIPELDANLYTLPSSAHGTLITGPKKTTRKRNVDGVSSTRSVSTYSTVGSAGAPHPPLPPRGALVPHGTAVAVSYGRSQVRALQKIVRERRQLEGSLATAHACGGVARGSSVIPTTTTATAALHDMWVPTTEIVTRVVRPTVVVFCDHCARVFEAELEVNVAGQSAAEPRVGAAASDVVQTPHAYRCPHCAGETLLEADEAWWAAARCPEEPPSDPVTTTRNLPSRSAARVSAAAAVAEAVMSAVSGGTDSIGFPDDDDDPDGIGSFQAALAEVRAAMAASRKGGAAETPAKTSRDCPSSTQNRPKGVATGTETQTAGRTNTPSELAVTWSECLRGVLFMHIWDVTEGEG